MWGAMRLLLAACLLFAPAAHAGGFDLEDEAPALPFRLSGLFETRFAQTSQARSWLEGGPGKLRYGGKDVDANGSGDRGSTLFTVPKASLLLDVPVLKAGELHLHLDLDADNDLRESRIGVIEAFGAFERSFEPWAARLRVGALIPPVSLEHPEPGWTTRYTVTPSAIASWIGEEVRAFGPEAAIEFSGAEHAARATASVFSGSDMSGHLLLYRGWALHDYTADLSAVYSPGGVRTRPFRELDGRPGFYGRAEARLFNDLVRLTGGYWDNNGDLDAGVADGAAILWTWQTRFWDTGAQLDWRRLTLIAQFMRGESANLVCSRWDWQAAFALASYRLAGSLRASARYDRFQGNGRSWEDGYALTGAVLWDPAARQTLALEYVYAYAHPGLAVRPRTQKDQLVQLNYRWRWGMR